MFRFTNITIFPLAQVTVECCAESLETMSADALVEVSCHTEVDI